jgi:glycerol-3-phosphate dehydrogenase (NAD(P)+)
MARIAILGAGFMGSALTVPATDNGHTVALWGTHLDDHLIAAVRAGARHPKLGIPLPAAVIPFDSTELPRALAGAELVINAVTSDGALPVLKRAAGRMPPGVPVLSVSKGLAQCRGRAVTLSDAIAEATGLHIVTVGGPSKAFELARRVPTAVTYGSPAAAVRRRIRAWLETPYYRIEETADQRGLELCSALKNAYAIAIGLCDGLVTAGRAEAMYNTKSALYTQALGEITRLGRTVGMRGKTVHGLGGAGDLHVTGMAGRNRIFGELRGSGRPTKDVVAALKARDELTEGYAAIRWCWRFARERKVAGVPLLQALHRIVYGGRDVERELSAACFAPQSLSRYPLTTISGAGLKSSSTARAKPIRS